MDLTPNNSSNNILASISSVFDLLGFSQTVCNFSKKILASTSFMLTPNLSGPREVLYFLELICFLEISCFLELCCLLELSCFSRKSV